MGAYCKGAFVSGGFCLKKVKISGSILSGGLCPGFEKMGANGGGFCPGGNCPWAFV